MSVSNGSTIWHIGLQCVSELAYVCRSMIRHVGLRPSMLVSNMGMSVSDGSPRWSMLMSPMKHVKVTDEACRGLCWRCRGLIGSMSKYLGFKKKLLLSETYWRPIRDLNAWSETHVRPRCFIRDRSEMDMPQLVTDMPHQRLTCFVGDLHTWSEANIHA